MGLWLQKNSMCSQPESIKNNAAGVFSPFSKFQ